MGEWDDYFYIVIFVSLYNGSLPHSLLQAPVRRPSSLPRYSWRSPSTSANLTMPEAEVPGVPQGAVGCETSLENSGALGFSCSLAIGWLAAPEGLSFIAVVYLDVNLMLCKVCLGHATVGWGGANNVPWHLHLVCVMVTKYAATLADVVNVCEHKFHGMFIVLFAACTCLWHSWEKMLLSPSGMGFLRTTSISKLFFPKVLKKPSFRLHEIQFSWFWVGPRSTKWHSLNAFQRWHI